ncbi:MAG: sigma-70 family RNA polymerase sigma factor [Rhodothermales bacterium]
MPTNDPSPVDIEALLAGNRTEFEKLVIQESPRLFRILVRMLGDDDEARSIMQETWLQAWQRLDSFRRESKLTTWLYAIGINLARGVLRKAKRTRPLDEHDVGHLQPSFNRGMFEHHVDAWSPEQFAILADRKQVVHDAIDRLPDDYREVVIMRDIEEMDTDDVARALDLSNGAVRVRLHRARQALRALLQAQMNDQAHHYGETP